MVTKKPKEPSPEHAIQNNQPTGTDIVKHMKNSIKISFGDAEENVTKLFDTVIGQLGAAAQQINAMQSMINHYESFLKENNIPLEAATPKQPGTPGMNRELRRKLQKIAEKSKPKPIQPSKTA